MLTALVLAAFTVALAPPDFGELIREWGPVMVGAAVTLGLSHVIADAMRAAWQKFKGNAAATPTKVDDFFVHVMDPHMEGFFQLVDEGRIDEAKRKYAALRGMVQKK